MELTIEQALQQGVAAHKEGKLQEAERLYRAILQSQPLHPDANHNLGVLAVSVNKAGAALPLFKTALEANPKIEQFWLSYIDALIKEKQFDNAIEIFEQAKKQGMTREKLNVLAAQLNSASQKKRLALKEKREKLAEAKRKKKIVSSSVNPTDTEVNNLFLLYQNKQFDDAEKLALSMTEEFPEHAFGWKILGVVLNKKGKADKALHADQKSVELSPQDAEAHSNLGISLQKLGKLEEAEASYTQAIALKPDYPEAHANLGNTLQELGRLEEAGAGYAQAIALKPNYTEAHYYLGNTLTKLSRLEEARESYTQAVALNPDFAEAHYNLANTLQELDRLEEAAESYAQAIASKPDFAEAHSNLGNALQKLDRFEEAEVIFRQAIALKPDYHEAHSNLGNTLQELGKLERAAESYTQAIALKPDFAAAYYNIGTVLKRVVLDKPNTDLQKIVVTLLEKETYVGPREISRAVISLLKFEPLFQRAFEKYSAGKLTQTLLETISDLSDLPLLLKFMGVCPIPDPDLEGLFKETRSCLLLLNSKSIENPETLCFQSALALQCFTNEYIYSQTAEESNALKKLESTIEKGFTSGIQPSPHSILCLASYKALYEYKWCKLLTTNSYIDEVFTRQILEPKEEASLRSNIPVLQEITNRVSSRVREQYEANPYPRWINSGLEINPKTISEIVKNINLKIYNDSVIDVVSPNILIAGCGTGEHSIRTASRIKNSEVLAVDLSLSSLAYAKRKTEELGIQNLEYIQADILDLRELDRQFNVIESGGVLHHMDDPMAGWRTLTSCLTLGGLMKIGLYSELARQHVLEMRDEIDKLGLELSDDLMRSFRSTVINSDEQHHRQILSSHDFYSLSTLRDLLFHVQEHRFSIPQIKKYLDELGLKFCGFENKSIVSDFKRSNTESDSLFDLDKWHSYEEIKPRTFAGMYQFWCQKIV